MSRGVTTSDVQTGAATVMTLPGTFCGIDVLPGASADFTVTVYDSNNATLTGKPVVAVARAVSGANSANSNENEAVLNNGLRCEVAGTAGSYVVRFKMG